MINHTFFHKNRRRKAAFPRLIQKKGAKKGSRAKTLLPEAQRTGGHSSPAGAASKDRTV